MGFFESHCSESLLSDPLGRVTIRSDHNRQAKLMGLSRVGRVGLRSDN